jgi:hypothetical protein
MLLWFSLHIAGDTRSVDRVSPILILLAGNLLLRSGIAFLTYPKLVSMFWLRFEGHESVEIAPKIVIHAPHGIYLFSPIEHFRYALGAALIKVGLEPDP